LIANLRNPEVVGLNYIYETADKKITYLMKNAFGFGGINVSVVAGKYQ
jgi:3-oxoacyl-(acyl-carrier-protein) synthase